VSVDLLGKLCYRVHAVNFGASPTRPRGASVEFYNLRSEIYVTPRARFRRGARSLPPGRETELLMEKLAAVHREPVANVTLSVPHSPP
jgi:hypothetical protein